MDGADSPLVSCAEFDSIMNVYNSDLSEPLTNTRSVHAKRRHQSRSSIDSLTQTSQYHVEHLSTFVLERKAGLMTVEDGIRRLRLLDAKGKVWTQELLLQVDQRTLSLVDLDTTSELETFPVCCVQLCQAVTEACSYDSILALVVREAGQSKPDLHLFQCDRPRAALIHADIQSALHDAKGGKAKPRRPDVLKMILRSDALIPPPPADPAPQPPPTSGKAGLCSVWTNQQQDHQLQRAAPKEPMEMTADRVDRDVQILNRLLDDIEFFIGRLQKSAEAQSQLDRRRRRNKAPRSRGPGEGVLTLRSRAPPPDDFTDCLQKFKHAFNKLAGLQNHIQNPSAADLLHFLFTPLRMVIQSCGSVGVARDVIVPLLSSDTIDFLHSVGTPEERHLWVTLGEGWTKSRLEWPKDHPFPAHRLKFRDGWEPPSLTTEDTPPPTTGDTPPPRRDQCPASSHQSLPPSRGVATTTWTQDSALTLLNNALGADRLSSEGRVHRFVVKSKFDFEARNDNELSVRRDQLLQVLDCSKQWWKVTNGCGESGYVPNNILEAGQGVELSARGRAEPVYSHTIQLMMPRREFDMFKQLLGELNEVNLSSGGCGRGLEDVRVNPVTPPPQKHTTTRRIATPPSSLTPPPSLQSHQDVPPSGAPQVQQLDQDQDQDQEVHRASVVPRCQDKVPGPGASSRSITYDSSPQDVSHWLRDKGFSPVTISSLGVLTGAQLFSLNKEELRTVCPDDGGRVFSQVAVQKAALEVFF